MLRTREKILPLPAFPPTMVKFENMNQIQPNLRLRFRCNLQCERCEARNASTGQRCSRKVCTGLSEPLNFCFQHRQRAQITRKQKQDGENPKYYGLGVKVEASTIAGAGQGVFATQDFKKNKKINIYVGENLDQDVLDARYGEGSTASPYAMKGAGDVEYIDAACRRGLASLINATKGTNKKANVRFGVDSKNNVAVYTKRRIKKGDELLISYGSQYWKNMDRNQHSTKQGNYRNISEEGEYKELVFQAP